MDHCRQQQQRPSVSVNPFLHPSPAAFYKYCLQPSLMNKTHLGQQYNQQFWPRQSQILRPQDHTRRQRIPNYPYAAHQVVAMNPALNNDDQTFSTGYSSEDARVMLTAGFDDSMFASNYAPSTYHSPAYGLVPFRPLEPLPTFHTQSNMAPLNVDIEPLQGFGIQTDMASLKVENDPPTGIMPLQTTHVDPEQYTPVEYEELWNTPTDPSSPSTIDTDGDSPMTPAFDQRGMFFDKYTGKYGLPEPRLLPTEAPPVQGQLMAQTSFGSFKSDSSVSYAGSSFGAPSPPRDCTSSWPQQHHGLSVDYAPSHVGSAVSGVTNPSFDPYETIFEDNLSEEESNEDAASASSSSSTVEPAVVRNDRDRLLLSMRNQGVSYKEIRRLGNFKEAESTLRGRMRVLTKEKHERVRKPVWENRDVLLLQRAVKECHCKSPRTKRTAKMPWLKISEWVNNHGASYAFAPATCAKKWTEIKRK